MKPPRNTPSVSGFLLTSLLVVSLLAVFFSLTLKGNITAQSATAPGNIPFAAPLASSPEPYPTDWLAPKQTAEAARGQTEQADALTSPPRCVTGIPPQTAHPPTYTPEPFISGIFYSQGFQAPGYVLSNWWQDIVNGEPVSVYVGARLDNYAVTQAASQGVVMVSSSSPDGSNWDFFTYDAPFTNTGVLIIMAPNKY